MYSVMWEGVRMCSVMWEGVMKVVSGYVCVIESVSKKNFPASHISRNVCILHPQVHCDQT